MNFDSPDDRYPLETFKRHFGPPNYSFDYGKVHFIVLDDVEWHGRTEERRGWYKGKIDERQLEWIKNDLKYIEQDRLIVFTMHIPVKMIKRSGEVVFLENTERLFQILKGREHLLFLGGHTHTLEHHYLGSRDGWEGKFPIRQITCGTVSGSWWSGPKDVRGIPVADMTDGTPNGYHVFHFFGNRYSEKYKAAGKGIEYQMRFISPAGTIKKEKMAGKKIIVNIFNGSELSHVECKVNDRPGFQMDKEVITDSFIVDLYEKNQDTLKSWVKPKTSRHIWTAPLPEDLKPGIHTITVHTLDQYGQFFQSSRVFICED
jgi:hypothetical protein